MLPDVPVRTGQHVGEHMDQHDDGHRHRQVDPVGATEVDTRVEHPYRHPEGVGGDDDEHVDDGERNVRAHPCG